MNDAVIQDLLLKNLVLYIATLPFLIFLGMGSILYYAGKTKASTEMIIDYTSKLKFPFIFYKLDQESADKMLATPIFTGIMYRGIFSFLPMVALIYMSIELLYTPDYKGLIVHLLIFLLEVLTFLKFWFLGRNIKNSNS